jgi:hypothetical protein
MTCLRTIAVSAPCVKCGKREEPCHVVTEEDSVFYCENCCVVCGKERQ